MPRNNGTFRDANIAADSHRITFDPGPRPELEVGTKDHNIAGYTLVDPEVGENRGSPGGSLSHSGNHQSQEQEEVQTNEIYWSSRHSETLRQRRAVSATQTRPKMLTKPAPARNAGSRVAAAARAPVATAELQSETLVPSAIHP